jgi:thiosulfate/3-mercaptopyruvate sulfurtransferase
MTMLSNRSVRYKLFVSLVAVAVIALECSTAKAGTLASALPPGSPDLIRPEELAKVLRSSGATKPTILNVGPRLIYVQAHIPGAVYIGPTSNAQGLANLRTRAASLPRNSPIVIYCGCCPWEHCPNVLPAYKELKQMGFTRLKVLYMANSFGSDWVEKGYPTAKGE